MKDQERLKAQIEKTLPGDSTEISGLPIFYQGFDDGWIYAANDATAESDEIKKIRRKLQQQGKPDTTINNLPGPEDEILRFYRERDRIRVRDEENERARQNEASRLRAEKRADKMSGSAAEKISSRPKLAVDDATRKQCILDNGGCLFEVKDNPDANGSAPFIEDDDWSEVGKYAPIIERVAKEFDVDPDLMKAIMYLETTHGYYDNLVSWYNGNDSILPMNINVVFWGDAFGTREELQDPEANIMAGARMIKAV
ncbi:hypothetical protein [Dongia sp.]|uniref:hypothetical protein n=1 Tax=Dongia sp. TaxID=1977262 RepID=UPI0035B27643